MSDIKCTGAWDCTADVHIEGCFSADPYAHPSRVVTLTEGEPWPERKA